MDNKETFRLYMKAAITTSAPPGRHLSEAELVALHQGQLPASERETARLHLADCDECLQVFGDTRDFFNPAREDETPVGDLEARREWKDLWSRIQAGEETSTLYTPRKRAFAASRATLALAASLVLAIGIGVLALLWRLERQEKFQARQAAERLQTDRQELLARIDQLEQSAKQSESERIKQESERARALESQLAALNQPQTNIAEYEMLLTGEARGGGDQYEIKVPPSARSYALKIMPDKPEEFTSYVVELIDRQNRRVWESEKLRLDANGGLIIGFPRAFLGEGKYLLRLYGWDGRANRRVGEYDLTLTFSR